MADSKVLKTLKDKIAELQAENDKLRSERTPAPTNSSAGTSAASAAPASPVAPATEKTSSTNSENASSLEKAMKLMIETFHKYSGSEGDKRKLSRNELKKLLKNEFGNYLGNVKDKDAVGKAMADLDSNNDEAVDFTEFIILVGSLTVACDDFFFEYNKKEEEK